MIYVTFEHEIYFIYFFKFILDFLVNATRS